MRWIKKLFCKHERITYENDYSEILGIDFKTQNTICYKCGAR